MSSVLWSVPLEPIFCGYQCEVNNHNGSCLTSLEPEVEHLLNKDMRITAAHVGLLLAHLLHLDVWVEFMDNLIHLLLGAAAGWQAAASAGLTAWTSSHVSCPACCVSQASAWSTIQVIIDFFFVTRVLLDMVSFSISQIICPHQCSCPLALQNYAVLEVNNQNLLSNNFYGHLSSPWPAKWMSMKFLFFFLMIPAFALFSLGSLIPQNWTCELGLKLLITLIQGNCHYDEVLPSVKFLFFVRLSHFACLIGQ
jgi:hypothetical protein